MKKILLALTLIGCGSEVNKAEVIAKGQNPELTCDTAVTKTNKVHVAVCYLTDKEKNVHTFITATSDNYPFQAFALKSTKQIEAEAEAKAKQAQPAPTPEAGSAAPKVEKK